MRKKVYLYGRVSTLRQAENIASIESQLAGMRLHAELNNSEVVKEYVDEGVSGRTDKRPQFRQMIRDAVAGEDGVTEILCYSYSRFFRDFYLQEKYRHELEGAGVKLVSVSEQSEDDDLSDRHEL